MPETVTDERERRSPSDEAPDAEDPPPRRMPPPVATVALVAVNVAMALVQFAAGGFRWLDEEIAAPPTDWALGAKVPSLIAQGEYWRLVTASFLHGSWLHLAFNVLALLLLGRLVELVFGPARMLAIYVLSCVAGMLASFYLTPFVSLGASTGILGLMGALIVHHRRYRRYLPRRLNQVYPFFVVLVLLQLALDARSGTVDTFGHLGGMLGGGVMALLLESRIAGEWQSERDWVPLPTALGTAAALLFYGMFGLLASLPNQTLLLEAGRTPEPLARARVLRRVLEHRPRFLEAHLYYMDLLRSAGAVDEAIRHYREAVRRDPDLRDSVQTRRALEQLVAFYRLRAARAYQVGDWSAVLDSSRIVIQLARDPRILAEAHNTYAWTLADRLGHALDEAERHALTADRLDPGNAAILDTVAWVYYRQGRYAEALERQLQAVEIAERRPPESREALAELYYHLGAIQEKLGLREEAIVAYHRALEHRRDYPEAREALRRLAGENPQLPPPRQPPFRLPAGRRELI